GPNHSAALDAALQQPGCPPRYFLALPVVPPLVPSVADSSLSTSGSSPTVYSPLNEHERQINDDYEWCLHDPEVRRQYGGQVVVAHRRRIWGAGRDHGVAWDAALQHPDCPHQRVCAFVVVPPLVPAPSDSSPSEAYP